MPRNPEMAHKSPIIPEKAHIGKDRDAIERKEGEHNPFRTAAGPKKGSNLGNFAHHINEQLEFKPQRNEISESHDQLSSFEIKASFILGGEPDVLDLYKVKDTDYGIKLTNLGKQDDHMNVLMEWSPVMRLAVSDSSQVK